VRGNSGRCLTIPDHLVQAVLANFAGPGGRGAGPERGDAVALEAYIRLWGRLYELTAERRQIRYWTTDPAKDLRLVDLRDILRWLRAWKQWVDEVSTLPGTALSKK